MNTTQIIQTLAGAQDLHFAFVKFNDTIAALHSPNDGQNSLNVFTNATECILNFISGSIFIVSDMLTNPVTKVGIETANGFIALAADMLALIRQSCAARKANAFSESLGREIDIFTNEVNQPGMSVDEIRHAMEVLAELQKMLAEEKEKSFRKSADAWWRGIHFTSSLLVALAIICPPLLIAGAGVLATGMLFEKIDKNNNYVISHWVADHVKKAEASIAHCSIFAGKINAANDSEIEMVELSNINLA